MQISWIHSPSSWPDEAELYPVVQNDRVSVLAWWWQREDRLQLANTERLRLVDDENTKSRSIGPAKTTRVKSEDCDRIQSILPAVNIVSSTISYTDYVSNEQGLLCSANQVLFLPAISCLGLTNVARYPVVINNSQYVSGQYLGLGLGINGFQSPDLEIPVIANDQVKKVTNRDLTEAFTRERVIPFSNVRRTALVGNSYEYSWVIIDDILYRRSKELERGAYSDKGTLFEEINIEKANRELRKTSLELIPAVRFSNYGSFRTTEFPVVITTNHMMLMTHTGGYNHLDQPAVNIHHYTIGNNEAELSNVFSIKLPTVEEVYPSLQGYLHFGRSRIFVDTCGTVLHLCIPVCYPLLSEDKNSLNRPLMLRMTMDIES